ncbi:hypothetical protein [Lentilitoribacter sp. Alg239-R112]|uniref:hypothetical protein n=1 Tax=Lentilitoribacter sp. Alg239-R112 TaxID=2305987 RepID=UPI0013A6F91F|nr:hypothetical protein [Lentilitoribacter sp. Alg239-R112]
MMQHTNIIPIRIDCQTMSGGINLLLNKAGDQAAYVQTLYQIRIKNRQEIPKATAQVIIHTTSAVDKATMSQLKRYTQNLKSP